MARIKRGGRTERTKWQHTLHDYDGTSSVGATCDKCGFRQGNSIHGDPEKIAQRIADREEREYDEKHAVPAEA